MLLALVVGTLCAKVDPAPQRDAAAAAAYVSVGESELASGANDTALVAFRQALELDPDNARAREALTKLCATADAPDPFEEGVKLLDAGDTREALAKFEEARKVSADAGVALMEGICHYELEEDLAARPLLAEAENDPVTARQARFFLGLIALRNGDRAEAANRFASATGSTDPRLSAAAADLLRLSHRDGRFVAGAAIDVRGDSNVSLTPDGIASTASNPDGAVVGTLNFSARPLGYAHGLYVSSSGVWREQFTKHAYNFGGAGAAVGWDGARGNLSGSVEAGAENYWLAGSEYLFAARLLASGRWSLGKLSLGASYRARGEKFGGNYADYSGLRHTAMVDGTWRFDRGSFISLAWLGEKDDALNPPDGFDETGPWARAQWRVNSNLRLGASASILARAFHIPHDREGRADVPLTAEVYGEYDLSEQFVLRTSLGVQRTWSEPTTYTNFYGSIGLAWVQGFL